jgi:adenosine deaminase
MAASGIAGELAALRALPKAELHLHLDGAVRLDTALELASEAGIPLGADEARRRMVAPPRCRDQAELLTFFELPLSLLQRASALERAASELVDDLAADGVTYAEVRWAPRLHLEDGLSVRDVIKAVVVGVASATRALGSDAPLVTLIVTAMRSHPPGANVELARAASGFAGSVVGFDLAGPEATYPAPPHAAAFRAAEEGGLALTAHAGEVAGPERIREALDLGVRRIAHGVTTAGDSTLVAMVRERDVTLDLCPTSNVQAGIVPSLAEHPLAELHRAGVSVTISTDDRTVSSTTLSQEMARTATALGMSRTELAAVAVNGFQRGFAPQAELSRMEAVAADAWQAWVVS